MEKWKENRSFIIITSIITLLPAIVGIMLWSKLPDKMATHFGSGNVPNGWSSKPFAVIGIPLVILACHLLSSFATCVDPKKKGIDGKVFKLVLLICPLVSLFCGVTIYGYALSYDINIERLAKLFVGFIFVLIGNYLPKCRQNYTIGIKLPWTLEDEGNWNRTHRLAGWIWMPCGLLVMLHAFVPFGGIWVLLGMMAIMVIVPTVYSYVDYIRHKKL